MAKAKRERRSSIRTMPTEQGVEALDRLEQLERLDREAPKDADAQRTAEPPARDAADD
jgi:hypothetical protein